MTAAEQLLEKFNILKKRVMRQYMWEQYIDGCMEVFRAQNQITEAQYETYRKRKQEYLG